MPTLQLQIKFIFTLADIKTFYKNAKSRLGKYEHDPEDCKILRVVVFVDETERIF